MSVGFSQEWLFALRRQRPRRRWYRLSPMKPSRDAVPASGGNENIATLIVAIQNTVQNETSRVKISNEKGRRVKRESFRWGNFKVARDRNSVRKNYGKRHSGDSPFNWKYFSKLLFKLFAHLVRRQKNFSTQLIIGKIADAAKESGVENDERKRLRWVRDINNWFSRKRELNPNLWKVFFTNTRGRSVHSSRDRPSFFTS